MSSYTTVAYVEQEIRASTSFSATTNPTLETVNRWIEEESDIIDSRTNNVFSIHVASSILFDYDGSSVFRLPQSPIYEVSSLEYNDAVMGQVSNWILLEEGTDKNYIVYNDEGEIEFVNGVNSSNKIIPKSGKQRLRVSYKYGESSTPSFIQRLATLATAKRVIMSLLNTQANTQGGNIQVGTISVTDPSNYGVTWFKNIDNEINNIYNNIGYSVKTFRLTRRYN